MPVEVSLLALIEVDHADARALLPPWLVENMKKLEANPADGNLWRICAHQLGQAKEVELCRACRVLSSCEALVFTPSDETNAWPKLEGIPKHAHFREKVEGRWRGDLLSIVAELAKHLAIEVTSAQNRLRELGEL